MVGGDTEIFYQLYTRNKNTWPSQTEASETLLHLIFKLGRIDFVFILLSYGFFESCGAEYLGNRDHDYRLYFEYMAVNNDLQMFHEFISMDISCFGLAKEDIVSMPVIACRNGFFRIPKSFF